MIIGICGYKGAGKSTVCEVAINLTRSHHNFIRIGFSDPITKMFRAFGVPDDVIHDKSRWDEPLDILCGKTLRFAYTSLGTEWGRKMIGEQLWTNRAILRCVEFMHRSQTPIIDNVRFPSEAQALLDRGGKIIGFHNFRVVPDLSHESEQYISEIQAATPYRFNNDNSLGQSAAEFLSLLNRLANEI